MKKIIDPQTWWETITPEKATKIIEQQVRNRRVNWRAVKRYARYMTRGRWLPTGETIEFDEHGNLIQGQHRLYAIIESGVAVRFLCVRHIATEYTIDGIAMRTQDVLDQGFARKAGGNMELAGIRKPHKVAACCKTIMSICVSSGMSYGMATPETLEIAAEFGESIERILDVHWKRGSDFAIAPIMGTLAFAHAIAPERVEMFAERIGTMENVSAGTPVMRLHDWVKANKASMQAGCSARMGLIRATANAAMAQIKGNRCKALKADSDGLDFLVSQQLDRVEMVRDIFADATAAA